MVPEPLLTHQGAKCGSGASTHQGTEYGSEASTHQGTECGQHTQEECEGTGRGPQPHYIVEQRAVDAGGEDTQQEPVQYQLDGHVGGGRVEASGQLTLHHLQSDDGATEWEGGKGGGLDASGQLTLHHLQGGGGRRGRGARGPYLSVGEQ